MFTGLSAFPLSPLKQGALDEDAFARVIQRLATAGVDSIGALGSTGNYAYLNRTERARIAQLAVEQAGSVPVIVGIGALRTRDVLDLADDAQRAGAHGVLLAPMSYQKLSPDEVFGLYDAVTKQLSVPLVVYDNPNTTNFTFSDALHARIASLPNIGAIKIPPVPLDLPAARERVRTLRALIPPHIKIGISGDPAAATGLLAGCDAWYSVVGGLFPTLALAITRAALAGDTTQAAALSERLAPVWTAFREQGGSLRVTATLAELLERVDTPCLPPPLRSLDGEARRQLADWLSDAAASQTPLS